MSSKESPSGSRSSPLTPLATLLRLQLVLLEQGQELDSDSGLLALGLAGLLRGLSREAVSELLQAFLEVEERHWGSSAKKQPKTKS